VKPCVSEVVTNILKKTVSSIFHPDGGGSIFLQNYENHCRTTHYIS
jgi:hypothetical protein